jgi:hypothetical protein
VLRGDLVELVPFNSAWSVEKRHIKGIKHNRTRPLEYIIVPPDKSVARWKQGTSQQRKALYNAGCKAR